MPETDHANIHLYYAPRSRSISALWLLEELGVDYQLHSFNLRSGRHKQDDFLALNPMGKVPVVVDGSTPVAEIGAIAIYLCDRYPGAGLAPAPDEHDRAAYLRWIFFASAIIEPAFGEKFFKWTVPASTVAWGSFDQMIDVATQGVSPGPYLLGERFSAADVLVGGNLRFGIQFGILPKDGAIADYVARLTQRPAFVRAQAIEEREGERFPAPTPAA